MAPAVLRVLRPGRVPYADGVALQAGLEAARIDGRIPDTLVVLEHPPVITLGRRPCRGNVLASPETLASMGVELHSTTRGGDATYHGPGQVVVYVIVSLRELRLRASELVSALEEAMIETAASHGVAAARIAGKPGVFVGNDKLGAVGLHISRGVTTHGLALNVDPDLSHFDLIVPCGLRGHGVTSLRRQLAAPPDRVAIEGCLVASLARGLGLRHVEGGGGDDTTSVAMAPAAGTAP